MIPEPTRDGRSTPEAAQAETATHGSESDTASDGPCESHSGAAGRDTAGGRAPGERAQSTLIGFLLLFGILVLLVAIIQVSAVPDWNRGVEVQHNERVIGDMQELTGSIHQVGRTGTARSSTVELGTRYPTRPFLINPTDPAGTIRTTESAPFEVRNVDIRGVDNYWSGADEVGVIEGTTRRLVYEPDYSEHTAAPETVYENGLLYNEREGQAVLAQEPFVDGSRLSLVALQGSLDRASPGRVTVSARPESAPAQAIPVSSADGDPLMIALPTRLPEAKWEELLATEFERNGGNIVGNETGVTVTDGTLTVALAAGVEYDLRMARVAVGDQAEPTEPRYLTDVEGAETPIGPGQSERLVFEVRDAFNNPRSDIPVTFEATGGDLSRTSATTGTDGRVAVRYTAPASGGNQSVTATADIEGGATPGAKEQSTVNVSVVSGPGGGGGGNDSFLGVNPGPGADQVAAIDPERVDTGVDFTFRNQRDTSMELIEIRVAFYNTDNTQALATSGTYQFNGVQTFDIPGDFVAVNGPTLAPAGQAGSDATVSFRDFRKDPRNDFFLMYAVWEDGAGERSVQPYFINIKRR